ncbi:MAG: alpha/beta fold hydrolase [Ktedonobacterales bacterium]
MTTSKFTPERIGDWGSPAAGTADGYSEERLVMTDGANLFFRAWKSSDAQAPTLALIHGLGAHSGWFVDMANELHLKGLTVYAVDHRGFGRSDGPRAHTRKGSVYVDDLTAWLTEVKRRQPQSPLFILGHSMGAIFSLFVAAADTHRQSPLLSGLILMNPWIDNQNNPSLPTVLGLVFDGMRGSERRFKGAGGSETMTRNPEAEQFLDADTFWVRDQSAAFLYQISRLRLGAVGKANQVHIPALVIQCEQDRAVKPAASRRAYDKLGSADKTWKTYPGFAHDCEFEPERAILDDDIAAWVKAHSA